MDNVVDQTNLGWIQQLLAQRIGADRLNTWFQGDVTWEAKSESLRIVFGNEFQLDCVRSFCQKDLRGVVDEALGSSAQLLLEFSASPIQTPKPPLAIGGATRREEAITESRSVASPANSMPNGTIDRSERRLATENGRRMGFGAPEEEKTVYRGRTIPAPISSSPSRPTISEMKVDHWSEFIEGSASRMARTAAEMVLERPGSLTPLLIHGPSGVGKTHLVRGIGEQLRARHQLRRVIYLTAEQFTIDFTDSARGSGFASFRKKYRDLDAILIDDIQFFVGKGATLIELRNTIDNLIRNSKQVVFVSDRSLAELTGIGNELHARIAGGMVCSIEPMDEETRCHLLKRLCEKHSIRIGMEALQSLVRMGSGDARVLHGLAFRMLTAQRSLRREITESEAIECCQDLLRASQPIVRMTDIEKAVCDIFGLEPKSLQAKSKVKTISQPRMLAMFLARKYTRAAYSEIGHYFGNRQHSTVISAQRKVEDWLETNSKLDHSRGSMSVRDMLRNLEATLQVG